MMRWLWVVLLFVGCLEEFPELMTQPPRETQLDGTVDQAITDVLPVQDMEPVPDMKPVKDMRPVPDMKPGRDMPVEDMEPDKAPLVDAQVDQRVEMPRAPMPGELFINEVDYNQVSDDVADFVEIYNGSDSPLLLRPVRLDFINGTNGQTYMTSDVVPLGTVIQPHGYVIFAKEGAALPGGVETFPVLERLIQNQNESIVLFMGETKLDEFIYGSDVALTDLPTALNDPHSLARCPDGVGDWKYAPGTPGVPNVCN